MNEEHLAILNQGVDVWNEWRVDNRDIVPDLREANLFKADLRGADLGGANLTGVNLPGANLTKIKYDNDTVWPADFEPPEQWKVGL